MIPILLGLEKNEKIVTSEKIVQQNAIPVNILRKYIKEEINSKTSQLEDLKDKLEERCSSFVAATLSIFFVGFAGLYSHVNEVNLSNVIFGWWTILALIILGGLTILITKLLVTNNLENTFKNTFIEILMLCKDNDLYKENENHKITDMKLNELLNETKKIALCL